MQPTPFELGPSVGDRLFCVGVKKARYRVDLDEAMEDAHHAIA